MPTPLLEIEDLVVRYRRPGAAPLDALRGVSLTVAAGEALGIVGESGSGKSTLVRAIVGLVSPHSGRIRYEGADVAGFDRAARARYRRRVQMVFQDATGSLNPRMTVHAMLEEALRVHGLWPGTECGARSAECGVRVASQAVGQLDHPTSDHPTSDLRPLTSDPILRLLAEVGLPPEARGAYPRELSGGQCQRVSLARCLALEPRVLLADEPVSALDVSVQARVLNLLRRLQRRHGLALVLVSHDLAVVRSVCDRVCVLLEGRIVEQGPVDEVLAQPQHAYTRTLLAAVPDIDRALASAGVFPYSNGPAG